LLQCAEDDDILLSVPCSTTNVFKFWNAVKQRETAHKTRKRGQTNERRPTTTETTTTLTAMSDHEDHTQAAGASSTATTKNATDIFIPATPSTAHRHHA
jgi:hypothetical protein